jgi:hypothetical protein
MLRREVPQHYYEMPLIRSYAEIGEDNHIYRVEVRGFTKGRKVQVRTPMPHRVSDPPCGDAEGTRA